MLVFFLSVFGASVLSQMTLWNYIVLLMSPESIGNCFVRFYSSKCLFSNASAAEFFKAADKFRNFTFRDIDCDKFKRLCQKYSVIGTPTFALFWKGQSFIFTEQRKASRMIRFIESKTNHSVLAISNSYVREVGIYDIYEHLNDNNTCNVFIIRHGWDRISRQVSKVTLNEVVPVFAGDDNINFYFHDADNAKSSADLFRHNLLVKRDILWSYEIRSKVTKEDIIAFLSNVCYLRRFANGTLNADVGFANGTAPSFHEVLAASSNHTFYAAVANRVRKHGPNILKNLLETTLTLYQTAQMSPRTKNGLNIRINILNSMIDSLTAHV